MTSLWKFVHAQAALREALRTKQAPVLSGPAEHYIVVFGSGTVARSIPILHSNPLGPFTRTQIPVLCFGVRLPAAPHGICTLILKAHLRDARSGLGVCCAKTQGN